jgi:acid phosphatase family membrane protein YuiD
MQYLQRIFFGNYILSVSLLSWLAAQVCKTIINYFLSGKFEAERLWGAGGMPSAHSALVCSLFIATAKQEGVNSPFFAFAFVLAAIVMYDAMGVRREAGEQAKLLNRMMDDWMSEEGEIPLLGNVKRLKERVGHTPLEVLSGALLGILIAVLVPVPV